MRQMLDSISQLVEEHATKEEHSIFEEQLPALNKGPLVRQKIEPRQVEELLNKFL